ncbi:MAG: hypothetical protein RSE25_05875 [Bacteroidales bacterium]
MAMYDNKPAMYEANNNGSYTYRWDIKEVQVSSGMRSEEDAATTTKLECREVIVWGTVTKDKLTESVVTTLWANDYEKKLINDYNAAKEGVFGSVTGATAKAYIARYKEFLAQRKAIKEQIESDCATINIF